MVWNIAHFVGVPVSRCTLNAYWFQLYTLCDTAIASQAGCGLGYTISEGTAHSTASLANYIAMGLVPDTEPQCVHLSTKSGIHVG